MVGDEILKMIRERLDGIDDRLKETDKKLLWLCTHAAERDARLVNIEGDIGEIKDHIEKHDVRLDKFEQRISCLEGKVVVAAIVITAVLSVFINMVV